MHTVYFTCVYVSGSMKLALNSPHLPFGFSGILEISILQRQGMFLSPLPPTKMEKMIFNRLQLDLGDLNYGLLFLEQICSTEIFEWVNI